MEPLPFTEDEFRASLKSEGFLSPLLDEARLHFVQQETVWFNHARALNREGLLALGRRDEAVVGRTTHDPVSIVTRLIMRAFNSFQGAVVLYERGMPIEGNTLARSVYEIAFWMGFIAAKPNDGARAIRNEEMRSQLGRAKFFIRQIESGAIEVQAAVLNDLNEMVARLSSSIAGTRRLGTEEVAKEGGLATYYDAYKHLSASSAHVSLNSLHHYLKRNPDGTYEGHIWGPDVEALGESLSLICVGLGVCLALFGMMVEVDEDESELKRLLQETDEIRFSQKAKGKHFTTLV